MPPINPEPDEIEKAFLKKKDFVSRKLSRLLKKAIKLAVQRKETLDSCRRWQTVKHEGDLLQANLYRIEKGMREIAVPDWLEGGQEKLLSLDPKLLPHAQAAKLFKRGRKLRLGEPHAERMLKIAHQAIQRLQQQMDMLDNISTAEGLSQFCTSFGIDAEKKGAPAVQKRAEPPKPYRVFLTFSGMQAWVGKSARDNDKLTFNCAKGSDWWLHVKDFPGSHVVLRTLKNHEPNQEDIRDAAELALRFSKAQGCEEGSVVVSQVKFLARIKGAPGKVQLSKHKTMHIRVDEDRCKRLRQLGKDQESKSST